MVLFAQKGNPVVLVIASKLFVPKNINRESVKNFFTYQVAPPRDMFGCGIPGNKPCFMF